MQWSLLWQLAPWKLNWDLDFWRQLCPIIRVWCNEWHSSCVYCIIAVGQDAGPWGQIVYINTTHSHVSWWRPETFSRMLDMNFTVKKLVIQEHFTMRIFLITIIVLGDSYQHYEQQLQIIFNTKRNLNPSFLKGSWRKNNTWMKMTVARKAIMCHKHHKKKKWKFYFSHLVIQK